MQKYHSQMLTLKKIIFFLFSSGFINMLDFLTLLKSHRESPPM